jgi:hypothetical protein
VTQASAPIGAKKGNIQNAFRQYIGALTAIYCPEGALTLPV